MASRSILLEERQQTLLTLPVIIKPILLDAQSLSMASATSDQRQQCHLHGVADVSPA